jgi:bifunctional non-homologous end joining protein LigD
MAGKLREYRGKRDARRTPEPVPALDGTDRDGGDTFVIQEHHARRLHWDVRLERDGVLASWAVPMGLPPEPEATHLAVHTEDHPLEYATFEGEIPAGEYGAGKMLIWDQGRYDTLHWNDHKVEVVLHGHRAHGRYVFVNQHAEDERNWLVRRMDPARSGWEHLPAFLPPMFPKDGMLPPIEEDDDWAYEFDWSGERASARVSGGRAAFRDRTGEDIGTSFPELRGLGEQLGSTEVYLDGEIVVLDDGKPSADALNRRLEVTATAEAKRLVERLPALYVAYDVLHLDGRSCLELPYLERRALLTELELAGPHWQSPEHYLGEGGAVLAASRANGLAGVVAKRADSAYQHGKRGAKWLEVTGVRVQEVVIGGWRADGNSTADDFGSLLLGVPDGDALRYIGNVGSGVTTRQREALVPRLRRLARKSSPFHSVPPAHERDAHWVTPKLVGEVMFREWTKAGYLRSARWRGLRPGRRTEEVTAGG